MEAEKEINVEEARRIAKGYSCPSCAAPLGFLPEKGVLYCEYCNKEIEFSGIKSTAENDFLTTSEEDLSWCSETKVVHCDNCGSNNVVDSSQISMSCPFCGSNHVVESKELSGKKPDRAIPFKKGSDIIQDNYKKWIKRKIFAPRKVKKNIPNLKINGVYLPVWTFDSNTTSAYNGRLGKRYTVVVGSGKNSKVKTEIRYFNVKGVQNVNFDDVLVSGGSKISQNELEKIAPFDTNGAYVYDKRYLAGFSAEHYTIRLNSGWDKAKLLMKDSIRKKILSKYNYDIVSYLNVNTKYENIKYKYVLIPIWIGIFMYANKSYRFIANGESGKVHGKYPVSPLKVTLFVIMIVIIAIIILYLYFSIAE